MLRTAASRASNQGQEASMVLLAHTRQYFTPISVEFSEDVSGGAKASKTAPNIVADWQSTKAATEQTMKMMQMYKDLGDFEGQPYLKFHNPRTFEAMNKPIPNFKKFGLKAGEVPKFFDNVLSKRASEAVSLKGHWWDARRSAAQEGIKEKQFQPFAKLPVPAWQFGQPVELTALTAVTDKYFKALEPTRKLKVPALPAQVTQQLDTLSKNIGAGGADLKALLEKAVSERSYVEVNGKPAPSFKYMNAADAAKVLGDRRSQVHARWVKLWAKRILATPEQALVPLKERDQLLASKHEDVSEKYNALLDLVGKGPTTYAERMAALPAMDTFFLRRSKDEVKALFPVSEKDSEAVTLAAKLEDKAWALEQLLGPTLQPEGSSNRLKSEEARVLTEHLYTPDRYMFAEGMKLVKRYEQEEKELADKLTKMTGSADGLLAAQRTPLTPLQRIAQHSQEVAGAINALKQQKAEAKGNPYLEYAIDKQLAFLSNPENITFEEVELPEVIKERFEIEMAELDAEEAKLVEAEEEELWLMTLQQQSKHIQQHIEFDLPQAAYAHMDPILYKKLDWELTHGHDLLHQEAFQAADCEQGEYVKDQMGLENLSHHLLPLVRYRRQKYRSKMGYYAPELTALPVKAKVVL
eukprot:GHUV01000730.1.p1 GENE.GHUV01000730.1~~GHUV01000730.1.p1  ORF type:complete len:638 (+),score=262.56 GHUV01000730.1:185-2098(+)